jgi:hypothetical protein
LEGIFCLLPKDNKRPRRDCFWVIFVYLGYIAKYFNCLKINLMERKNLYDILDKMRERPGMYLGSHSITRLEAFICGFYEGSNDEVPENPPFGDFNDFVGKFYGKYTTAGWKNLILADHYGNEQEALDRFFVLLDEYRENPNKPNSRAIILRLMHVAMLDFRAEDDHQRQKQIADLLHHVSNQLGDAIYGGISVWYDNILQDIFERANGNEYLHHWIKSNAPSTVQYEYELWSCSDENVVITTVIPSNHQQKDIVIDPCEQLIKTFFAINQDKANEVKEEFQKKLTKMEEQKKIISKHDLSFFTEYYQFYILDSETKAQTDAADFWNDEAGQRKLAIGEGLLGVTVAKYAEIKVEVRVLSAEPTEDADADHIVETSLNLPSGLLQVKDCTNYDTELELNLEKGTYRVRISSFKLWTVENDKGDDYYVVEIWRYAFVETEVLRAWLGVPGKNIY